ncbi:MAG: hypothetical protein MUO72_02160 [Bacteroidales bacterium]|nr:hypothetical protein [Bacteroidales bacterium]
MKRPLSVILLLLLYFTGCNKTDNPKLSGIDTINNLLYGEGPYYAIGLNFSTAEKVSTLKDPGPDITLENDGTLINLILQTDMGLNAFNLMGEYADAASSQQAFNNLTSPVVTEWADWAFSIKPDQVWIYRSGTEHYAKIRIISTISETRNSRDYAECTFEWVYQPDGTLTFPGK